MPKNLPDVTGSATLGRGDLARFARLEGQIEKALQVAREPIGTALRAIRDGRLYLATHASFERYVVERWGFSKATAYRMMDGEKLVSISPPENASSQVSTSHGETDRGEPSTIGSPPPAESPEGLDQQDYTGPASEPTKPGGADSANDLPTPSGPSSEGGEQDEETRPALRRRPPSGQSSEGGVDAGTAPGLMTPTAPSDPPEDVPGSPDPAHQRPLNPHELVAETPVDVDAIGLRWLKSKTTREVRAIGDPWGPAIRSEVRRWAEAFGAPPAPTEKPQRRQGTLSAAVGYGGPNGTAGRPSARIVPTAARIGGKRHADDCSCLSCVPPKAAAK